MTSHENLTPYEQPPSYEDAIRTEIITPPTSLQVATIHQFHNHNTTPDVYQTVPVPDIAAHPSGFCSRKEHFLWNLILLTVSVLPIWKIGKAPDIVTCKHCGYNTVPRGSILYPKSTHFWALILCLVGWVCCLFTSKMLISCLSDSVVAFVVFLTVWRVTRTPSIFARTASNSSEQVVEGARENFQHGTCEKWLIFVFLL